MAYPDEHMPDANEGSFLKYLYETDSEEEEEEEDEMLEQFFAAYSRWKTERKWKWKHECLDWNDHVAKLVHQENFDRTYRMSLDALNTLLEHLRPWIQPDLVKSLNSCDEPIFPELVLATGLRWLAGGKYVDLKEVYDYSTSSYYRCRDLFLNAVLACDALRIKWPSTFV
jgi:hypothetical protein